jgi:protein-disulfide isomerase
MRVFFRFVFISVLISGTVQVGLAGQQGDKANRDKDISDLKKEMESLKDTQRQILEELKELKALLQQGGQPGGQQTQMLNIKGEAFKGDETAKVAIIEYSDFECPFCGKYAREVFPQVVQNYVKTGKVRYYYRDLPLPMHPNAFPAARAARCAGEQGKFWEMHDSLFANQAALTKNDISARAGSIGLDVSKFNECLASDRYGDIIRKSATGAERLGVNGTPAFAFGVITAGGDVVKVNNLEMGTGSYDSFKAEIDELLSSVEKK